MIGFWPEFEGAACYAARKYFGDNNRRCSRKKEYETYQINKIQVSIFNVKCLGDIATRSYFLLKKTVFLEILFPRIKKITGC
ncbi:Protein CBG20466 [Caenorhabditis briggsae]|uniref:Protein CBG20466 n=1 Tax=Caenorhabditis briggsae TaxID=6238 RepID=E3CU77_CAEBR|nr:Protein CBG20466 [Caenorhabditis briggsae]CBX32957.1 Protein CBG20466 [Caenorhabditis briggsae]